MNVLYVKRVKKTKKYDEPIYGIIDINPFKVRAHPFILQLDEIRSFFVSYLIEIEQSEWALKKDIYNVHYPYDFSYLLSVKPDQIIVWPTFPGINCIAVSDGMEYHLPQKQPTDILYYKKELFDMKVTLPVLTDVILLSQNKQLRVDSRRSATSTNQLRLIYNNRPFLLTPTHITVKSVTEVNVYNEFKKLLTQFNTKAAEMEDDIIKEYKKLGAQLVKKKIKKQTNYQKYNYLFPANYTRLCDKSRRPKFVFLNDGKDAENLLDPTKLPFPKSRDPPLFAVCSNGYPGIVKNHEVPCCFRTKRKNWDNYFKKTEQKYSQSKVAITMKSLQPGATGELPIELENWVTSMTNDMSPKYRMGHDINKLETVKPVFYAASQQFPSISYDRFSSLKKKVSLQLMRNKFKDNIVWITFQNKMTYFLNFVDLQNIPDWKKDGTFILILVTEMGYEIIVDENKNPVRIPNYNSVVQWLGQYKPLYTNVYNKPNAGNCEVDALGKTVQLDCKDVPPLPSLLVTRKVCDKELSVIKSFEVLRKKSRELKYKWLTDSNSSVSSDMKEIAGYLRSHQKRFNPPLPPPPNNVASFTYLGIDNVKNCLRNIFCTRVFNDIMPELDEVYYVEKDGEFYTCKNIELDSELEYVSLSYPLPRNKNVVYRHLNKIKSTSIV